MKHFAVLLMFAASATAAPLPEANIANMVAQSDAVMNAGVCAVANDTKPKRGETMTILLPPPVGVRKILVSDYQWIRSAGYKKHKGRWVMSERIEQACRKDADSSRCIAARSYWRQF